MALQNEKQSPSSPVDAEVARLKAAVDDLSARVSRLESGPSVKSIATAAGQMASVQSPFGLKLINRIGALTLAIGVIFFFKYAVDENLIGASAGVLLGIVFGFAMLAGGEWLIKRDQRIFAQGVSGCGLATIYISVYASFAFYKLILDSAGFTALVLVSALAVGLSIRYQNPAIAALGFIGALLTPALLPSAKSEPWLGLPYLMLVELTAVVIALRQRWAVLIPVVAPLALIAAAVLFEPKFGWRLAILCLALAVLHFASLAFSPAVATIRNSLYVVGHCCLLVAGFRIIDLVISWTSVVRELDSVLLAVYGIAILFYGMLRTSFVDRVFGLVLLGLVIAKLYLSDVWMLARGYRITAFVGLGVLLLAASYIYSRSDKQTPRSS